MVSLFLILNLIQVLIRYLEFAIGGRHLLMEMQLYISGIACSTEVQKAFFKWFKSNWSLWVQCKIGIFVRSSGIFYGSSF